VTKAKRTRGNGSSDRVGRLEREQKETNRRLGKIDDTLAVSSRLFELMHQRLEALEVGQGTLVEGQKQMIRRLAAMEDGQKLVIDRLDRLVEASTRDRTAVVERLAVVEDRLDRLEQRRGNA
jgi:hypothetical protein